jgi:heme oxygenase
MVAAAMGARPIQRGKMEHRLAHRRLILREATAKAHRELEQELGEIGSRDDYARYLSAMCRFRGAIEPRLTDAADDFGWRRPTELSERLALDCRDIGLRSPTPVAATIDCDGEAGLGVGYVLEGSSLGAALLFRSAQGLGFDGDFGARHLARQLERRANWTAFLSALEAKPALDMAKVAEAANATFRLAQAAAREAGHAA